MFHSKVDLVFSSSQELQDIIKKYSVTTPEGRTILQGPSLVPGDRVKWLSSRYGWTEGEVIEVRARRKKGKYERVNGEWVKMYPPGYEEQIKVVGEYKSTYNGRTSEYRCTVVIRPSSLIKIN